MLNVKLLLEDERPLIGTTLTIEKRPTKSNQNDELHENLFYTLATVL